MIFVSFISRILNATACFLVDAISIISRSHSGNPPRPGEISLAHEGILFLDELPEFDRKVLEALREPLESGVVHIARAARHAVFPARFQLIAAMNPCPCGFHGDASGRCRCTPEQIDRYRGKLSGPFLDRIDLFVEVPALPAEELQAPPSGETSAAVRTRVAAALARQIERQGHANHRLGGAGIDTHCALDASAAQLLVRASQQLGLSARAQHRVRRIARTIADLAGSAEIAANHIAEAIQFRRLAQRV